jgi:hypothetical protein
MKSNDAYAKVMICQGGGDPEFSAMLDRLSLGAEFMEGRLIIVAEKKTNGSAAAVASASNPSAKK